MVITEREIALDPQETPDRVEIPISDLYTSPDPGPAVQVLLDQGTEVVIVHED